MKFIFLRFFFWAKVSFPLCMQIVHCTVLHSEDLLRGNDAIRQKKTAMKTGKMYK
jgi:hypothetical protein